MLPSVNKTNPTWASTGLVAIFILAMVGFGVDSQQNGEVMAPELRLGRSTGPLVSQSFAAPNNTNNSSMKIQYIDVNGQPVLVQFSYVGPPKILPISTADSYPEGSLINLICTVSGGQRRGLSFSWMKNNQELDPQALRYSDELAHVHITADIPDISVLKIQNASSADSGIYTCNAKNPLGQDSTSVKILINVDLKWTKVPRDVETGLNQDVAIECDATGAPEPEIEWRRHLLSSDSSGPNSNGTTLVSKGKLLKIPRAQMKDSGLYECTAHNGVDTDLRKVIQVKIKGK